MIPHKRTRTSAYTGHPRRTQGVDASVPHCESEKKKTKYSKMGVKYLWTILTPFCERKPLYELQGKTVAVDLSCWICEAQNIAEYQVQPRMYLRNLYFRTCYLLLLDVNPVFVLEGKAPELKYDTISARNAIQFKGAKPKSDKVKTGKDRTRFNFVLKQCEEMLGYMGLACIKGTGEAESLCAYLNEDGLVDGCISQDSDCFAYGAQVVYRNFSISTQGAHSSSGGAVDVYDIRKANESMKFGRNKIVAMALLIGCDYSDGVHGIGKDSVLKLFEVTSNEEILERLRSWRKSTSLYENFEKEISDKNVCTSCGHSGKLQRHTQKGCGECNTTKGCDPFKFKAKRLSIKNELNIRNKAVQDPNFPDEALIQEFLVRKDNISELNLKWKQPNLVKFIKFTQKFLQWEEIYAFEKILPVLTRWQLFNFKLVQNGDNLKGVLYPDRIKKVRNPRGVPSYEIIWSDPLNFFKGLIPEKQIQDSNIDVEKLWSTIEPQNLVQTAYPKLVQDFNLSKIKPKKQSKRKKQQENDEVPQNTSVAEPKPKKTRKPRAPKKKTDENILNDLENSFTELTIEKNKPPKSNALENFLKKAVINTQKQKNSNAATLIDSTSVLKELESSFNELVIESKVAVAIKQKNSTENKCISSTPAKKMTEEKKKLETDFDFDVSSFGDDENDFDVSDIVDNIISRKLPSYVEENLRKIVLNEAKVDLNASSFFISNPVENDLFEKTFDKRFEESSGEETEDYDFNENVEENCDRSNSGVFQSEEKCDKSDDDSFSEVYVPLYERLTNKF